MRKLGSVLLVTLVLFAVYWWGEQFGFPTYMNVITAIVLAILCYFIIGGGSA